MYLKKNHLLYSTFDLLNLGNINKTKEKSCIIYNYFNYFFLIREYIDYTIQISVISLKEISKIYSNINITLNYVANIGINLMNYACYKYSFHKKFLEINYIVRKYKFDYMYGKSILIPFTSHQVWYSNSDKIFSKFALQSFVNRVIILNSHFSSWNHYLWTNKSVINKILSSLYYETNEVIFIKHCNIEIKMYENLFNNKKFQFYYENFSYKAIPINNADFLRLYVLNKFGGVYFDLDYKILSYDSILHYIVDAYIPMHKEQLWLTNTIMGTKIHSGAFEEAVKNGFSHFYNIQEKAKYQCSQTGNIFSHASSSHNKMLYMMGNSKDIVFLPDIRNYLNIDYIIPYYTINDAFFNSSRIVMSIISSISIIDNFLWYLLESYYHKVGYDEQENSWKKEVLKFTDYKSYAYYSIIKQITVQKNILLYQNRMFFSNDSDFSFVVVNYNEPNLLKLKLKTFFQFNAQYVKQIILLNYLLKTSFSYIYEEYIPREQIFQNSSSIKIITNKKDITQLDYVAKFYKEIKSEYIFYNEDSNNYYNREFMEKPTIFFDSQEFLYSHINKSLLLTWLENCNYITISYIFVLCQNLQKTNEVDKLISENLYLKEFNFNYQENKLIDLYILKDYEHLIHNKDIKNTVNDLFELITIINYINSDDCYMLCFNSEDCF